jgi:hypothetical protein
MTRRQRSGASPPRERPAREITSATSKQPGSDEDSPARQRQISCGRGSFRPGKQRLPPLCEQLELDFDHELSATERFEKFHTDNPRVYATLVMLARQWIDRTGHSKLGVATLYERARWDIAISTNDPNFKLNNDHRAFYARLIMLQEPDLAGLFKLRRSEADAWAAILRHTAVA